MDTGTAAILAALIGSTGTITAALITRAREKKSETSDPPSPPAPQTTPPTRSRFYLILLLGFSITANAVLFALVNPLSKPVALTKQEPSDAPKITRTVSGSSDEGTVTLTVPPGTYMTGIRFGFNKGSAHGIVNNVEPLYTPLPSPHR
jgi:hypothetical protein